MYEMRLPVFAAYLPPCHLSLKIAVTSAEILCSILLQFQNILIMGIEGRPVDTNLLAKLEPLPA